MPTDRRVFVCLAAYEPDPALLDRQLASLSAQTLVEWSGVVVDDASSPARRALLAARVAMEPRLRLVACDRRVGFYRNFERALAFVPADVPFVALCDQDDRWWPEKLARQVDALERSPAALAYTDLRVVERDGSVRAPSFWTQRPHDRSLRALVYNNVATGAAMLLRRELLDVALPFPDAGGDGFHDHWLALCAAATTGLSYVDEPLVDYTQHAQNVVGITPLADFGRSAELRLAARSLGELLGDPRALLGRLDRLADYAYRTHARLTSWSRVLVDRVPHLSPGLRIGLRPFLGSSRLLGAFDLVGPTTWASRWAGEATNLDPLKIAIGLAWQALRRP